MHSVNQSWINNENSQIKAKGVFDIKVFNQDIVPDYVDFAHASSAKVHCMELFAFSCTMTSSDYLDFVFESPRTIDTTNFSIKINSSFVNHRININLLDQNDTVIYGWNSAIQPVAGTYSGITRIRFSPQDATSYDFVCKYMSFGKTTNLSNGDIEKIEYTGHCDILNKDLPYHHLLFNTLDNIVPISENTMCYAELVNYSGFVGRVPIGCGYYYLDKNEYKDEGFRQQLLFVDILSTMTNKFIYGKTTNNNSFKDIVRWACGFYYSHYEYLPRRFVYNFSITNLDDTTTRNLPVDKTCAETLQLVAQSQGKTLYVNEENFITFLDVENKSVIDDDNPVWLLDKPALDVSDKVKKFVINLYGFKANGSGTITTFDTEIGVNYVDLNGVHNITSPTESLGIIDIITYNFVVKEYQSAQTQTVSGSTLSLVQSRQYQYTIYQNGTQEMVLDLVLSSYDTDFSTTKNYYRNFLKRTSKTTLKVRNDAKYFLLDKLHNAKYGEFVIEDISTDFITGLLKGTATQSLLAPRFRYDDEDEYGLYFYNPNYVKVMLWIRTSGNWHQYGYINPLEEKHIVAGVGDELLDCIIEYDNWTLDDDIVCNFENEETGEESDNVVLFNSNQGEAITPPVVKITRIGLNEYNEPYYTFEITNPNASCEIYVGWSSESEVFPVNRFGKIIIEEGEYNWLDDAVLEYLTIGTAEDIFCYCDNGYDESDETIILERN